MQALKNSAISVRILALIIDGATLSEAIDAVLGAGTYSGIVSDLYDAIRAA